MKRNIVESYSIEEAFRALNKKPQRKVVESADANRTFAQVANVVPFKDFISGKSMIYFLQDFAGFTGELYIVSYNGDVYGLDTGNEIAEYICATHEVTSYDDLAEFANYSPNDIDGDVGLYGEKNIPVASFNYDGLNVEEFIKKFEFEPPRITETATKEIVEFVNDDLTNIVETQDAEAAADWILKNTACADPKSDIIEMCRDYGCKAQIYDILALDKYFRVAAPKLTKWWTIWDEDGAFGAAWNMLLVDSDNNIYGACAETQGGPFIYGLAFISPEELADYLAEHPVAGNYTPADVSDAVDTVEGHGGYNNPLAQKICDECEAILPDLDDEDYM